VTGQPVIALDARLVGYAAGIARYTVHLADALATLDEAEQYVILRGRRAREVHVGGPRAILVREDDLTTALTVVQTGQG